MTLLMPCWNRWSKWRKRFYEHGFPGLEEEAPAPHYRRRQLLPCYWHSEDLLKTGIV